jgi:hypothetical protein
MRQPRRVGAVELVALLILDLEGLARDGLAGHWFAAPTPRAVVDHPAAVVPRRAVVVARAVRPAKGVGLP